MAKPHRTIKKANHGSRPANSKAAQVQATQGTYVIEWSSSVRARGPGVAGKSFIVDPATIDLNHVVADIDEIRRCNQQRYEMEMLTAVVHIDPATGLIVGYKDVGESEFWVRGHMPSRPLMPGVLMCEVAAQLCSFAAQTGPPRAGCRWIRRTGRRTIPRAGPAGRSIGHGLPARKGSSRPHAGL